MVYIHNGILVMLCYAKSLQSCPTLCDPIDGSHQAPPSMGFSRQEYWSGVPLPSPILVIRKNEIMPLATIWMDLEIIILNEVSHRKTNII